MTGTAPSFTAELVSVNGTKVATGKDFESASVGQWRSSLDEARAHGAGRGSRHGDVHGAVRRGEAVPVVAEGAVHDLDPAAGGRPQAPPLGVAGDASGSGPVRAGLHQLHAYRQRQLSEEALSAVRAVKSTYGDQFLSSAPRQFTAKVKNAQEAHEAIRPTTPLRSPAARRELNGQELSLYRLIWQRTLASQMADAVGTTVSVRLAARASGDRRTGRLRVRGSGHDDHVPRLPPGLRRVHRRR